jgi:hypothetical protein
MIFDTEDAIATFCGLNFSTVVPSEQKSTNWVWTINFIRKHVHPMSYVVEIQAQQRHAGIKKPCLRFSTSKQAIWPCSQLNSTMKAWMKPVNTTLTVVLDIHANVNLIQNKSDLPIPLVTYNCLQPSHRTIFATASTPRLHSPQRMHQLPFSAK